MTTPLRTPAPLRTQEAADHMSTGPGGTAGGHRGSAAGHGRGDRPW